MKINPTPNPAIILSRPIATSGLYAKVWNVSPVIVQAVNSMVYVQLGTSVCLSISTKGTLWTALTSWLSSTCPNLTSLDLSAIDSAVLARFQAATCPLLSSVVLPSGTPPYTSIDLSACALPSAVVNALLAAAVAGAAGSGAFDTSGGTNEGPSGQGITDVGVLEGRSWTVSVN